MEGDKKPDIVKTVLVEETQKFLREHKKEITKRAEKRLRELRVKDEKSTKLP